MLQLWRIFIDAIYPSGIWLFAWSLAKYQGIHYCVEGFRWILIHILMQDSSGYRVEDFALKSFNISSLGYIMPEYHIRII